MVGTVYMLCGVPASMKSTWAEIHTDKLNATILSSDKVREQWYGDASIQGNNQKIFSYVHQQTRNLLELGENVIIDATNINWRLRKKFNQDFQEFKRKIIYFECSPVGCILRDKERKRSVGKEVILRMYKNLRKPLYIEGWDSIEIIKPSYMINIIKTIDKT